MDACWNDQLSDDSQVTLVTYGTTINDVLNAADRLRSEGVAVDVIKLDLIQPLNLRTVMSSARKTHRLVVVEETARQGCVGESILAAFMQSGVFTATRLLNLENGIVSHGDTNVLRAMCKIDAEHIYETVKELLRDET